jgi:hypothetical protein
MKLVEKVTGINQYDVDSITALSLTINSIKKEDILIYNILSRIKLLLDYSADAICTNIYGITLISVAAEFPLTVSYPEIAQSLRGIANSLLTLLLSRRSNTTKSINSKVLYRLISVLGRF